MNARPVSHLLSSLFLGAGTSWLVSSAVSNRPLDLRGPVTQAHSQRIQEFSAVEINALLARAITDEKHNYFYDAKNHSLVILPAQPEYLMIPVKGVSASALFDSYHQGRDDGRIHYAIDIMAPEDTPVLAADDGVIVRLYESDDGGLTIYQFNHDATRVYYYAHLEDYAEGLVEGMRVQKGDLIAYVGSTGNADDDAPHLHFAVHRLGPQKRWWQGTPVNPYPLLGGE